MHRNHDLIASSRHRLALVLGTIVATAAVGCSYRRTLVPHGPERTMAPAPLVQQLVGEVIQTALQKAVAGDLGELEGKPVCVEVEDVLTEGGVVSREYVRAEVEARLVAKGAHLACEATSTRVLVQLDQSGVDVIRSRTVDQGVAGIYAGVGAIAAAFLAKGLQHDALYEDDPAQTVAVLSIGGVAGLVDLVFLWLAPPVHDAVTLDAQSVLRLHVLPPPGAGAPRVTTGEARRELVIPDERDRAYEY